MITTSIGSFEFEAFIKGCNMNSLSWWGLKVYDSLSLACSPSLLKLPDCLSVIGSLALNGCESLKELPRKLEVIGSLKLAGCKALTSLPENLRVGVSLDLTGCYALKELPKGLSIPGNLCIWGCCSLTTLPSDIQVGDTILADSGFIRRYPFRELPKIAHLPFESRIKQIIFERLAHGKCT